MLKGSLRVGRIAGTTVRIHWTAVAIAALLGAVLVGDLGAVGRRRRCRQLLRRHPAATRLAHAVVARRFDIGTTSIELWGLGGMARLDREPRDPEGGRVDRGGRTA